METRRRKPAKKARKPGQMRPFTPEKIRRLEALLRQDGSGVFAITIRQHQRIIKTWCALLKLDGALYSTHSIRRTKPAHLYAKTKNLAACKELLGHANVSATGVYPGLTGDDARALARQFPI